MDYVVRVSLNLRDPSSKTATRAFQHLMLLDQDAEMAEGTANQVAFWTNVFAESLQVAVNTGADRVLESLQHALGIQASAGWPAEAQASSIEVYPLYEETDDVPAQAQAL